MEPVAGQTQTFSSRKRRAFYAFSGIAAVMTVGTIGFHQIEGMNWVNAVYFESMLATGQGPPIILTTDAGKIFASVMAFVSVGSVIAALFVTLIPILSQLWREAWEKAEKDVKRLERDLAPRKERPES